MEGFEDKKQPITGVPLETLLDKNDAHGCDVTGQAVESQPGTGIILEKCRLPTTEYKQHEVFYKQEQMQVKAAKVGDSLQISMDKLPENGIIPKKNSKRFTYYDTSENYYMTTARSSVRHDYEIITGKCCLYFDIEHCTPGQFKSSGEPEDDKLEIIVKTICQQAEAQWPQLIAGPLGAPLEKIIITTSSRHYKDVYKHSFHVNFPLIGFEKNWGNMKVFVENIAALDIITGKGDKMEKKSMVDDAVYTKNRNFRIIESCKNDDSSKVVFEFHPYRPHTMEALLETLVSNTRAVTHWISEGDTHESDIPIGKHKGTKRNRAAPLRPVDDRLTLSATVIIDLQNLLDTHGNHGCRVTGDFKISQSKQIVFMCNNQSAQGRNCLVTPDEVHANNNAYCVSSYGNDVIGDWMYFKCHSSKCKNKQICLGKSPASLLEWFNGVSQSPCKKYKNVEINAPIATPSGPSGPLGGPSGPLGGPSGPLGGPLNTMAVSVSPTFDTYWHSITETKLHRLLRIFCELFPEPAPLERLVRILKKYKYQTIFDELPALECNPEKYRTRKWEICDTSDCQDDLNTIVEMVNCKRLPENSSISDEVVLFFEIKKIYPFTHNITTNDLNELVDCFSSFDQSEKNKESFVVILKKFGYRSFFDRSALFDKMSQESRDVIWNSCDTSLCQQTLNDIGTMVNLRIENEDEKFRKIEKIYFEQSQPIEHQQRVTKTICEQFLTVEILDTGTRVTVFESGTGSGKTTAIVKLAKKLGMPVISVCARKTQVREHVKTFRHAGLKTTQYNDTNAGDFVIGEDSYVVTVDSIHKLRAALGNSVKYAGHYILLLDEIHSIAEHITHSETLKRNRKTVHADLRWLVKHTGLVHAMDNQITTADMMLLDNALCDSIDRDIAFVTNSYKKYAGIPVYFAEYKEMIDAIHGDMQKGNGFTAPCNTKIQAERLHQNCRQFAKCNLEYLKLYTQEQGVVPDDIDTEWSNCGVIYSPTITTGLDFNPIEAQNVYLFLKGEATISPATAIQMAARCRNIKQVYICAEDMRNKADYPSFSIMSDEIETLSIAPGASMGELASFIELQDTKINMETDIVELTETRFSNLWKVVHFDDIKSRSSFVYSLQCLLTRRGFNVIQQSIRRIYNGQDKESRRALDKINRQVKEKDVRDWQNGTHNENLDNILAAVTGIERHEIETHMPHLAMHKKRLLPAHGKFKYDIIRLFTDPNLRRTHKNLILACYTNSKLLDLCDSNDKTDFKINNLSSDEAKEHLRRDMIDIFNSGLSVQVSLTYQNLTLNQSDYDEDENIEIRDDMWVHFHHLYPKSSKPRPRNRKCLMDCIFGIARTLYGTRFTDKAYTRVRVEGHRKRQYNYATDMQVFDLFVHSTDWSYLSLDDIEAELVKSHGIELRQKNDVTARLENDRKMREQLKEDEIDLVMGPYAPTDMKLVARPCYAYLRGCCKKGTTCCYTHELGKEGSDLDAGVVPSKRLKLFRDLVELYGNFSYENPNPKLTPENFIENTIEN
jgi:hypothetical protein